MLFALAGLIAFVGTIVFLLVSIALAVLASIAITLLVSLRRTRAFGIAAAGAAGAGALIGALLYAAIAPLVFHAMTTPAWFILSALIGFAWTGSAVALLYGVCMIVLQSLRYFSISRAFSSMA